MTFLFKGMSIPDHMFIKAFGDHRLFSTREREDIIRAHLDRHYEGHEREEWLMGMLMSDDPLRSIAPEISFDMEAEWNRYHTEVQRDLLFYRGEE